MQQIERFRGCLLGMATGDAVGTTLEFCEPGTFNPLTDMIGGGPFMLKPGEWTDDTSMGLCLGASLLERKGFDPVDQMEKYYRWWKQGYMSSNGECFDMGGTVRKALTKFEETWEPYCGSTDRKHSGNGSIMRLGAIPMYYHKDIILSQKMAVDSSRTTHGSPQSVDCCRYMTGIVVGALNGLSKEVILSPKYLDDLYITNPLDPEVEAIRSGSFLREPPDINGDGYCITTLEAALWAFAKTDNFKDGCLRVVNLGLDSDSTGAVYGQVAGAYYGESGIPKDWLDKLAFREMISKIADEIYETNRVDMSTK